MTATVASLPTGNAALCISVASRPGRFGMTVHNAGYRALSLDFFYRACQADEIGPVIAAVRALGIRGCSVSMPFKEQVIPLVDKLAPSAARVCAVNTIVNASGCLIGHNTDVSGARRCLNALSVGPQTRVTLLGAGGAAKAIIEALCEAGVRDIDVFARSRSRAAALTKSGARVRDWGQRTNAAGGVLVNATPIGMDINDPSPVDRSVLASYEAVFDVVVSSRPTALIETAATAGCRTVDGFQMAFFQACDQFELYTGVPAPTDVMWEAAQSLRQAS